jgi:chorismate dehydratase
MRCERRPPAELVRGLRAGELDVALVSSIELFRQPGYRWIDGLAVAGDGFVGSVQVFLRRPLEAARTLALDPASRAAEALVRVLLSGRELAFVEVGDGADPREAGCDAWLRIGDAALREHLEPGSRPVFNPSEAWRARTGLPFVFALWVARAGIDLAPWAPAFARSRARGAARVAELAREAADAWNVPLAATRAYLEDECLFEPGARLGPALRAFRDAAARLGLAPGDREPRGVRAV